MNLVQFIDMKISGYHHTQPGRAKIFGFFAARDDMEPLRNYVFRRTIDNFEAVSVKRKTVISLANTSLFTSILIFWHVDIYSLFCKFGYLSQYVQEHNNNHNQ